MAASDHLVESEAYQKTKITDKNMTLQRMTPPIV
jgi:hypothetical protein